MRHSSDRQFTGFGRLDEAGSSRRKTLNYGRDECRIGARNAGRDGVSCRASARPVRFVSQLRWARALSVGFPGRRAAPRSTALSSARRHRSRPCRDRRVPDRRSIITTRGPAGICTRPMASTPTGLIEPTARSRLRPSCRAAAVHWASITDSNSPTIACSSNVCSMTTCRLRSRDRRIGRLGRSPGATGAVPVVRDSRRYGQIRG